MIGRGINGHVVPSIANWRYVVAFLCLCVSWGASVNVRAVGLGELELMSAFNEPFHARLQIVPGAAIDNIEEGIKSRVIGYGLASADEFARSGVRYDLAMLRKLKFEYMSHQGAHYIVVRSTDRIREPLLSFVVYIESVSGGRVLRTYRFPLEVLDR